MVDNQRSLTLQANAKINLTLDVGRVRSDGYHEISSVMQTVGLADTLVFTAIPAGISVTCDPPGSAPDGPSNLAYRALQSLAERTAGGVPGGVPGGANAPGASGSVSAPGGNCALGGIDLRITKRIPAAAGLGGGSSDAAAALKGACALYGLGLTELELASLAAGIGSDVAFFMRGGTALAQGRGEVITVLPTLRPQWLVLVRPEFEVSTAEAYANFRPQQSRAWTTRFLAAAARGDREGMLDSMGNDLEAVTAAAHSQISVLKTQLEQSGAERSLMSGSGPTVFGVFPGEDEARAAAARLDGGGVQVFVCRMTRPGEQVEQEYRQAGLTGPGK